MPSRSLVAGALRALPVWILFAACAGSPPGPTPQHDDFHHRTTTMLTVTTEGLVPDGTVRIPTQATVVWQNRTDAPIAVEVRGARCPSCDTVLGFAPGESCARSREIAPEQVVTLCFHEPGEFPFVVDRGGVAIEGRIVVEDE